MSGPAETTRTGSAKREWSLGPRSPRVAIGMPVHDGEDYVAEAIDSILGQTFEDFELVICDNASTDATEEICRGFAERDPRVRYLRNPRNLGAHPNYNRTFRESRGRYFKWAAHDDVLRPEFLEVCVRALDEDPEAVVAQSLLAYVDGAGHPIGTYDSRVAGAEGAGGSADPVRRFAAVVLRPHPAYEVMGLFRRSALEGSLLLESFHGADRALLAQMALRGRFVRAPEPLLVVRDHAERYTRARVRPRERAVWHDASRGGRISLPTWRLYGEYCAMIARELDRPADRARALGVLAAWWLRNWNGVRMAVDLAAVAAPGVVARAERLKQRWIAPAPGADEVRAVGAEVRYPSAR